MSTSVSGQGANSASTRLFNERLILDAVRRLGQASKADLSRYVHLTNNTAGIIVRELEARGLIRVEGKRSGSRGQPATLLTLNPDGAHAIGVKIGRRSIDTLLVDFCGRVLARHHRECEFSLPDQSFPLVLTDIRDLLRAVRGRAGQLAGIGVAMPFSMGSWHRELDIPSADYRTWNDVDVSGRLAAETGEAVFLENDGTAAAIAEMFQGRGRQIGSFLYLFIGSAIGGGVIFGNNYYRGVTGNAGDIGLMPVGPSRLASAPVPTHRYDILMTRASINSLMRHLRHNGVPPVPRSEIGRVYRDYPDLVGEWLDDCADALVVPLLSASSLLDVEAVIIDGDLPGEVKSDLMKRLAGLLAQSVPEARLPPRLLLGQIGREAPALGAAILPLHLNFSPIRETLVAQ